MDAISNLIYWQGNKDRGVNRDSVEFLRHMNQGQRTTSGNTSGSGGFISIYKCNQDSMGKVDWGFDYKWRYGLDE